MKPWYAPGFVEITVSAKHFSYQWIRIFRKKIFSDWRLLDLFLFWIIACTFAEVRHLLPVCFTALLIHCALHCTSFVCSRLLFIFNLSLFFFYCHFDNSIAHWITVTFFAFVFVLFWRHVKVGPSILLLMVFSTSFVRYN